MECDYTLKIILVGDCKVGKSTFFNKITNKEYKEYKTTIGLDFKSFIKMHDNKMLKINLWDTAGQGRFRCIIKRYFENICGIILIFDLNNIDTFNSTEEWIFDFIRYNKCDHEHPIILIGNKNDLKCNVDRKKINLLVDKYNLIYIETSIENNEIHHILNMLIDNIDNKIIKQNILCNGCISNFENNININHKRVIKEIKDNKDIKIKNTCCKIS